MADPRLDRVRQQLLQASSGQASPSRLGGGGGRLRSSFLFDPNRGAGPGPLDKIGGLFSSIATGLQGGDPTQAIRDREKLASEQNTRNNAIVQQAWDQLGATLKIMEDNNASAAMKEAFVKRSLTSGSLKGTPGAAAFLHSFAAGGAKFHDKKPGGKTTMFLDKEGKMSDGKPLRLRGGIVPKGQEGLHEVEFEFDSDGQLEFVSNKLIKDPRGFEEKQKADTLNDNLQELRKDGILKSAFEVAEARKAFSKSDNLQQQLMAAALANKLPEFFASLKEDSPILKKMQDRMAKQGQEGTTRAPAPGGGEVPQQDLSQFRDVGRQVMEGLRSGQLSEDQAMDAFVEAGMDPAVAAQVIDRMVGGR